MPTAPNSHLSAAKDANGWHELRVKVPLSWKRWLDEAAEARAMSVSDLVRQCIRSLMITRHQESSP